MLTRALSLILCLMTMFAYAEEAKDKALDIQILPISSLTFEAAPQGEPAQTVPPDGTLFGANASFRIYGEPFRVVYITLPHGNVFLQKMFGLGATDKLRISDFKSLPREGEGFKLGALGQKVFFVGATREKIQNHQKPGFYWGTFVVTVSYQ